MNEILGKANAVIIKANAVIIKANAVIAIAGPTLFVVIACCMFVLGVSHSRLEPAETLGYFFVAGCALVAAAITAKKN